MPLQPMAELPCACATVRRAARVLTQLYAEEFDGVLEGTQFSVLAIINRSPGITQATLGSMLALDKTTLSRNLNLMKRRRWLTAIPGKDRRERGLRITAEGLRLVEAARPGWQRAQDRLKKALGVAGWRRMFEVADHVTTVALRAQQTRIESMGDQVK